MEFLTYINHVTDPFHFATEFAIQSFDIIEIARVYIAVGSALVGTTKIKTQNQRVKKNVTLTNWHCAVEGKSRTKSQSSYC